MDKNLVINKYEVALFPKDFYVSDLNFLLSEVKGISVFKDGINTVIPLPPDAPREIPRILLRSKDKTIACNIGFDKVNIFWLNTKESTTYNKSVSEIQTTIKELSNLILPHTPTQKIKRIGYIKQFYYESNTPIILLKGQTIYDAVTKKLRDFIIQFTYNITLNIFKECNEVIIINSNAKKEIDGKKVIILTCDINTIQTQEVYWGTDEITNFIKEADTKSSKKELIERFFKQNVG